MGFRAGELQARVYDDVPPALLRWTGAGKAVAIFSSGSVRAQRMLFAHTQAGDLTPHLSGYFDTTIGFKTEPESYRRIAASLERAPEEILFVSDVMAELDAARRRGRADGSRRALGHDADGRDAPPGADLRPAGLRPSSLGRAVPRLPAARGSGGGARSRSRPRAGSFRTSSRTSTDPFATGRTGRTSSSPTGRSSSTARCTAATPPSASTRATGRSSRCTCPAAAATCASASAAARPRSGCTTRTAPSRATARARCCYEIRDRAARGGRRAARGGGRPAPPGGARRADRADGRPRRRSELLFAYGGVTGERGRRDGDIGTEAVPIGTYFQLRPEHCRGNAIALGAGGFRLTSPAATIAGLTPAGAMLAVADARRWDSPQALFDAGRRRRRRRSSPGTWRSAARRCSWRCERVSRTRRRSTRPRCRARSTRRSRTSRRCGARSQVETPDPYLERRRGRPERRRRRRVGRALGHRAARRRRLAHAPARLARPLRDGRARLARPRAPPPRVLGRTAEHRPDPRGAAAARRGRTPRAQRGRRCTATATCRARTTT